ncbi:hypothetical protein [Carnobacterium iners]|uniref:hypothetical protein n=1 Tax=Carnobacterium iners TaxID=1073423 RepID=UPI0013566AEB|nr:hypothetical protein [Carnobacterium iners]
MKAKGCQFVIFSQTPNQVTTTSPTTTNKLANANTIGINQVLTIPKQSKNR